MSLSGGAIIDKAHPYGSPSFHSTHAQYPPEGGRPIPWYHSYNLMVSCGGGGVASHIYCEETASLQSTEAPTRRTNTKNCNSPSCYDGAQADDEVHGLQANLPLVEQRGRGRGEKGEAEGRLMQNEMLVVKVTRCQQPITSHASCFSNSFTSFPSMSTSFYLILCIISV